MPFQPLEISQSQSLQPASESRLQEEATDSRAPKSGGFAHSVESVVDKIPAPIATFAAWASGALSRLPGDLGVAGKVAAAGVGLTYSSDLGLRVAEAPSKGLINESTGRDALVLGSLGLGAFSGGEFAKSMDTRPFNLPAEEWKVVPQWAEGTNYPEMRSKFLNGLTSFGEKDQHDIRRALSVAEDAHMGQLRKVHMGETVQDPFIIHPVRTAMILTDEAGVKDADTVVGALLHDTVEDSAGRYKVKDLSRAFNTNVGTMVDGVTKPPTIGPIKPSLDGYYSSLNDSSEGTRMIKLADRLDNMRDTENLTDPAFRARKMNETIDHYIPMAEKTSPFFDQELKRVVGQWQDSVNKT